MFQIDSHLTAKLFVDNAISDSVDESSMLRLDPDEKLKQDSITPNSSLTSPKSIIELPIECYVDPNIIRKPTQVDFKNKISITLDSLKETKCPQLRTI